MLHVAKHVLARLAYSSLSNLSLASFQAEEYIILLPHYLHLTAILSKIHLAAINNNWNINGSKTERCNTCRLAIAKSWIKKGQWKELGRTLY